MLVSLAQMKRYNWQSEVDTKSDCRATAISMRSYLVLKVAPMNTWKKTYSSTALCVTKQCFQISLLDQTPKQFMSETDDPYS
mmetsp:Transcript_23079/g.57326  ORF Transcript_23079/g.57326 Transcript_23079/m.57326 type:complete len:82 (+) Transcript_23079:524-769(+)